VHSLRSTRSYLNRPMSDISYVDEDSTLSPNYHHHHRNSASSTRNNNKGNNNMTNTVGTQYLKVEGTSYRVKSAPKKQTTSASSCTPVTNSVMTQSSADAQTQSAESSFEISQSHQSQQQSDYQQIPPCVQIAPPPPVASAATVAASAAAAPPPPQPPRASSPMQVHHQQAVTVQPPHGALQTHLLPSPIYGFGGYDPSYCQYLGQGADGYQYELVRRPSIGQPVELLVPQPQTHVRRASGGIPYLGPNSMQGSFDSQGPPPSTTPIFIQQPLSPRHLHRSSDQWHQPLQSGGGGPVGVGGGGSGSGGAGQHGAVAPPQSDEIPKLIHETSI